jgi:hypothetical protein
MTKIYDYASNTYVYVLTYNQEEELVKKFADKVSKYKVSIKENDSVYVLPKSSVTRNHLSVLKDDLNIKQIRKQNKADKIIFSTGLIKSFVQYKKSIEVVNLKHYINFLSHCIDEYDTIKQNHSLSYYSLPPLAELYDEVKTLKDLSIDTEFIGNPTNSHIIISNSNNLNKSFKEAEALMCQSQKYYYLFMQEKEYDNLQNLWKNRKKIVLEDAVISLVSKDNKVTLEAVESIGKMLSGSDADKELGVSTLCSLDFSGKVDILCYLFYKYGDSIRYTKSYSSAAMKHLKNIIQSRTLYSVTNIVNRLHFTNELTPDGLKLFLNQIAEEINKQYIVSNLETFVIEPKNITLNKKFDEIRSKLQFD